MSQDERIIQNNILDFIKLTAKDFYFLVYDSKGTYDTKTRGFRSAPKHSVKGVSDLIGFHLLTQKIIFAEIKTPKGVLSKDQKIFREEMKKKFAKYFIWKSIDDCEKDLNYLREFWA